MTTKFNDRPTLSITQCANKIMRMGHATTYMIEGGMGTGKSSILKLIQEEKGDVYNYVYVDCTQWDVGDVNLPDADKELMVVRFLPNVLLVGDGTKPMCIMLDELTKASRPVMNALLPVLLERRAGMRALPGGSIVCATGNLGAEGVGDSMQAHARNRITKLKMRPPSTEEWVTWGSNNCVNPVVLAWVRENPQVLQSFEDVKTPTDNPYIFHPKEQRESFVTPRSLVAASREIDDREGGASVEETLAGLWGTVGPRAAMDLRAFMELSEQLPRYAAVLADPMGTMVPTQPGAICMTIFSLVSRVEKGEWPDILGYVQRFPTEMQALFAVQLMRNKSKQTWAVLTPEFSKWVAKNSWALQ